LLVIVKHQELAASSLLLSIGLAIDTTATVGLLIEIRDKESLFCFSLLLIVELSLMPLSVQNFLDHYLTQKTQKTHQKVYNSQFSMTR
jgi:hypothetical protein